MNCKWIRLLALVVSAVSFFAGKANAQSPTQYDILQTIYGSLVNNGQGNGLTVLSPSNANYASNEAALASYWNKDLVSSKTWSYLSALNGVTATASIAFNSNNGNYALSTSTPSSTNTTTYGAINGKTTWGGAGTPFNNGNVNTFNYGGYVPNTFVKISGGGNDPPQGSGTITFTPPSNPFAFTVNQLNTTISNGTVLTQAQIDADTTSTATSMNSSDMVGYRIVIDGVVHFALLFNLEGTGSYNGGDPNGYTDLALDVTGVQNPEPTSLAMMGLGAFGLIGYRLRRRVKENVTEVPTTQAV